MIAGTLTLRPVKDQARGDGTAALRGSTIPWATQPPGPEAFITLVPRSPAAEKHVGGNMALHGSTNPNFSSTRMKRGQDGPAPGPLTSSLHHGPDALRQPFNKTSTAKNCRESWELRTTGGQPVRGTDAPWDSMRHYTAPASSLPPGPGWTYAQRHAPDITSSSTASTNQASWSRRLDAAGPSALLGSRTPNATMRVPSPSGSVPRNTGNLTSRSAEFNVTSTAENDMGSWGHRQANPANPRGAGAAGLSLTGSGRAGATFGSNYQKQRKPDITAWSTAAVDKDSWEHRVDQVFPDHLTFAATHSKRLSFQ